MRATAFRVAGREADAARPVSPAAAQATIRRGTRNSHTTWTPGRAATPDPAVRRPASRSRQSPRAGGHRRVPRGPSSGSPAADDKGQPVAVRWSARSSKSAAREPLVVSDPERARCVWLGRSSKKKTKPIPVSVIDRSIKVGTAHSADPRDHRDPRRQRRSPRVRGRPRCRGAWGSIRGRPGPRGHRSGSGRSRPNTSTSGALRDRRVRSQPGWHRPGSPRPATDPDSLYLRKDAAKAAVFGIRRGESRRSRWFSVVGRAGALARSRW